MHTPVLLKETIDGLNLFPGLTVFDGTLGGAGHARAVAEIIGSEGTFVGTDLDIAALARTRRALEHLDFPRVVLEQENFRNLDLVLAGAGITQIDRALFDLGLSSFQLEESGRGFSFQKNEPLLMTFAEAQGESSGRLTAYTVVNSWEEESLADIIFGFGGERYARRIAKAIAEYRLKKEIDSSEELAGIVAGAVPGSYRRGKLHPATKTFQAIRIAVNDELGAIKEALPKCWNVLAPGGRIAVISFHEHEDRIVKQFMREKKDREGAAPLTKKPIVPSPIEIRKNPRSRSAKLRIIEKVEKIDEH